MEISTREAEIIEVYPEEDVMLEDIDSDSEMNDMLILPEDSVEEVSRKRAANAAVLAKRKLLRVTNFLPKVINYIVLNILKDLVKRLALKALLDPQPIYNKYRYYYDE